MASVVQGPALRCLVAALAGIPPAANGQLSTDSLLSAAYGAPPEFAADAILVLAEHGLLQSRSDFRLRIEDAFQFAGAAQEKIAMRRLEGGSQFASTMQSAFRRGLDQVSLRARAARAMLATDPQAAAEMAERIAVPDGGDPGCESPFSKDLSLYYSVQAQIAGAIREPRRREQFLERLAVRLQSPADIEPFVRQILLGRNAPEAMDSVVYPFSSQLPKMARNRREFTAEYSRALAALADLARGLGGAARVALVAKTREWVLAGARQGTCGQRQSIVIRTDGSRANVVPSMPAEVFNRTMAPLAPPSQPAAIPADEVPRAAPGGLSRLSGNSAQFLDFGRVYLLLARDREKDSAGWKNETERYITQLSGWEYSGSQAGDAARFYLEKAFRLRELMEMPAEYIQRPARQADYAESLKKGEPAPLTGSERAMAALIELFEGATGSAVYDERRLVWFAPVREFAGSHSYTAAADDLLIRSRNPVLHLYGVLEATLRAAGRSLE